MTLATGLWPKLNSGPGSPLEGWAVCLSRNVLRAGWVFQSPPLCRPNNPKPSSKRTSLGSAVIIPLFLIGCNGTVPPAPKEVFIPVPVACLDKLPERPAFLADSDLATMPDYQFILSLRSDQLALRGHVAIQDALLQACVKTAPVSPP